MELLYFTIVFLLGAITATGNFQCPSHKTTYCICSISNYSEYNCQAPNVTDPYLSVGVHPQEIRITCNRGQIQSWPDLIEGINAPGSFIKNAPNVFESLVIIDCPIPEDTSVAEVLKKLSVRAIENLELKDCHNTLLTDRFLENLSVVHNLTIEGDIKPFSRKVLDGMPNLKYIHFPEDVMSHIRLEVLKQEALKRGSNSTQNNTHTDLTLIEELLKLSELNIRNTDAQILVGKISNWLSNVERVNLMNNNITFLLFESLPNLTHISITDNRIDNLQEGTFSNLTKLEQISMNYNTIMSQLESGTFKDLRSLLNVSLSENSLTCLPSYLFENCTNLMILDVSKNKLTALNENSLRGLTHLETLSLQDNLLTKIER